MIIIEKILNNNVVLTSNDKNEEIVVMGKGIAFKKRVGDKVSKSAIDKIYTLSDKDTLSKFEQLLADISMEYMSLSDDIINKAKVTLGKKLNDNIYIFGDSSDTVVERYAQGSYHAAKYYNENAAIKEAVDFITGEELKAIGDKDRLERLFNELVFKDWFMTFPDFDEYVKIREQAYADYENREEWVQKMLVNIAKAGYFSSDRTIEEYNRDIWKLED